MAPIRANHTLIGIQQHLLEKIESQGLIWAMFVAVSTCCSIVTIILLFVLGEPAVPIAITILIGIIILLCLAWLGWTIGFVVKSLKNQKIIYQLLQDISTDIEVISKEVNRNTIEVLDKLDKN